MGASKAQRAATAARRDAAIKLRLAGAGWQSIADQLGYHDRSAACTDVRRAMEANLARQHESADVRRAAELDRLDRLQLGLWKAATSGSTKAADTVLRIITLRAKLSGVDVPPDVEERIREEMTARISAQMAVVWGRTLSGIPGLTEEQRAAVPGLLDEAIRWFSGAAAGGGARAAIEGVVVGEDP